LGFVDRWGSHRHCRRGHGSNRVAFSRSSKITARVHHHPHDNHRAACYDHDNNGGDHDDRSGHYDHGAAQGTVEGQWQFGGREVDGEVSHHHNNHHGDNHHNDHSGAFDHRASNHRTTLDDHDNHTPDDHHDHATHYLRSVPVNG
jgi:hypothetical protein